MSHVLVVDDEPVVGALVARLLNGAGHRVSCVESGEAAIDFARINEIHVVILDYRLPGIDGHETLTVLHREHPSIGKIVVTGFGTIPLAVEAMRLGASEYLMKPFAVDDLLLAVRRVLEATSLREFSRNSPLEVLREFLSAESDRSSDDADALVRISRIMAGSEITPPLFAIYARTVGTLLISGGKPPGDALEGLRRQVIRLMVAESGHVSSWVHAAVARVSASAVAGKHLAEAQLAEDLAVSPAYLGRVVRTKTTLTIPEWKRTARVMRALPRVIFTNEQFAQIAYRVGYKHAQDFARDVSSLFGVTPTILRRRLGGLRDARDVAAIRLSLLC